MALIRRSPRGVLEQLRGLFPSDAELGEVRLLCRRGNDSLEAAHALSELQVDEARVRPILTFIDVRGGLQAYSREADPRFPSY